MKSEGAKGSRDRGAKARESPFAPRSLCPLIPLPLHFSFLTRILLISRKTGSDAPTIGSLQANSRELAIGSDSRIAGAFDLVKPSVSIRNFRGSNQPVHPHRPLRRRFVFDRGARQEFNVTLQEVLPELSVRCG